MRWIAIFILLLAAGSCVDPFALHPGDVPDYVVVFGRVSDRPGPYTITVTHRVGLDAKRVPTGITGARVKIVADDNTSDVLTDLGTGEYITDSLQGAVGRSYKLQIQTAEGERYESAFEELIPVGVLKNLRREFLLAVDSLDYDRRVRSNGFNIFLDADFTPEQEGHALWKWSGTFTYTTDPLHAGYTYGSRTFIPDPPPCTGYRAYNMFPNRPISAGNSGYVIVPITDPPPPCTCCTCWHTIHNDNLILSDENAVRGGTIKNMKLVFLPVGYLYFQTKFFMTVEQQSISPSVYAFYKQAKNLNDTGGNLFQTTPSMPSGNVFSVGENQRAIVGLFSVGSTRTDTISMKRKNVPYIIDPPMPYSTLPCEKYFSSETTNIKPPFF